jgi:hypothetical protein
VGLVGAGVWRLASTGPATPHYTYGGLPSWLPSSSVATNRVVHASAAHPQLAIEGNTVVASVAGGSTTVTMVGPTVPPFVAPPPPATTATFTVTLTKSSTPVVVRAKDFALIDGNGNRFYPSAFVGGATSIVVPAHVSRSVRLREYMAVGSGSIRWAPGGRPLVTWEYTVEND